MPSCHPRRFLVVAFVLLQALPVAEARSQQPAPQELAVRGDPNPQFLTFSPDSKTLALIGQEHLKGQKGFKYEIVLYDLAKGVETKRLAIPPKNRAQRLVVSPD